MDAVSCRQYISLVVQASQTSVYQHWHMDAVSYSILVSVVVQASQTSVYQHCTWMWSVMGDRYQWLFKHHRHRRISTCTWMQSVTGDRYQWLFKHHRHRCISTCTWMRSATYDTSHRLLQRYKSKVAKSNYLVINLKTEVAVRSNFFDQ
jgi:hypothetical protein